MQIAEDAQIIMLYVWENQTMSGIKLFPGGRRYEE
jgi:hypothetical protein